VEFKTKIQQNQKQLARRWTQMDADGLQIQNQHLKILKAQYHAGLRFSFLSEVHPDNPVN